MRLILASASPRRRELLRQIGVQPDEVRGPDIDETPLRGEAPRVYCRRMAESKVNEAEPGLEEIVLAADTAVAVGRTILGKPDDARCARAFLTKMSGRRHRVITAVAVKSAANLWLRDVVTIVRMKRLSESEIDAYIESGEWEGKAGAYGIQGKAGAFIPWLRGSFTSVVGLPLTETAGLLRAAGYLSDSGNDRL